VIESDVPPNSTQVLRKKLLSVLLSSKMPSVIHQLSVLNRDMFSSRSVYITYAETSLLARRRSGITVDCGIMYVPNGCWKQVGYVLRPDGLLDFVLEYAV
jgi:hypothetical protein